MCKSYISISSTLISVLCAARTDAERTSLNQSETSNNKTSLQRSNNKADPFYVASLYDKEPKDELENVNQHTQYNGTKSDSAEQLSQKSQSQTGTSLVNRRPCDYSPLQEENTQPMLTIHTEDEEYYTNDFQENRSPRVSINNHCTTALAGADPGEGAHPKYFRASLPRNLKSWIRPCLV